MNDPQTWRGFHCKRTVEMPSEHQLNAFINHCSKCISIRIDRPAVFPVFRFRHWMMHHDEAQRGDSFPLDDPEDDEPWRLRPSE